MVERGERLGFLLEALNAIRILRELAGEGLDGDRALEPRIARTIHLTHAATADQRADLVRPKHRSDDGHSGSMLHRPAGCSHAGLPRQGLDKMPPPWERMINNSWPRQRDKTCDS